MGLLSTLRFLWNHPINREHRLDALSRYVRWQVGGRLVQGELAYDWIMGLKFLLRSRETGLTGNVYCGLHEFSSMGYVLHTLGSEDLFVDIGANVGSYTLLACGGRKARGICVEPVPETFSRLSANVRLNDLSERVTALNIGLAEKEGEMLFTRSENTMNRVAGLEDQGKETVSVQVRTLDGILGGAVPSVIKIDVEGFETAVVRGGEKTFREPGLHSVIMELGGAGERYGYDEGELFRYMLSLGFGAYAYNPMNRTLYALGDQMGAVEVEGVSSDNALFVRDVERVRERLQGAPRIDVYGTML
ncbi:FkbM family methyltransferase [Myxococcota bacterium]|nr:FkbM family methyltransferase [Myxococcota bacterium]